MSIKVYRDLEDDAICKSLDIDLIFACECSRCNPEDTADKDLGYNIYEIYFMCERLKRYSYPPYKLDKSLLNDGRALPLKSAGLFLPPPDFEFYELARTMPVALHPCVALYAQLRRESALTKSDFGKVGSDKEGSYAERINQFATSLISKLNESAYKRTLDAIDKYCVNSYKLADNLVNDLLLKDGAIHAIRLDLWLSPGSILISEIKLNNMLASMLCSKNFEVFRYVRGVIYKSQYSACWGFGLNVTIFISPEYQIRGGNLAYHIGEFWNNVTTGGTGVYFDCANHPNIYKRAGLGLYPANNTFQVQDLLSSFAYLAKQGRFFLVGSALTSRLL